MQTSPSKQKKELNQTNNHTIHQNQSSFPKQTPAFRSNGFRKSWWLCERATVSLSGSALVSARCKRRRRRRTWGAIKRGRDERARTRMHPRVISTGVGVPAGWATGDGRAKKGSAKENDKKEGVLKVMWKSVFSVKVKSKFENDSGIYK